MSITPPDVSGDDASPPARVGERRPADARGHRSTRIASLGVSRSAPPPAPAVGGPAILAVHFGEIRAVDGVSFDAARGEVTAVLGPNGAGKTTTIETLEGYRRPTSGSVRVLGLDPIVDHAAMVGRIGVMLQEGGVYPGIRPPEMLALFAAYFDHPADPDELLTRVGLADRRHSTWRRLSGGEQQRLSLALALVGRPEVVFLDEPTAGIDPAGRQVVREIIRQLRDDGVGVVVTTHDLDDAERLADRVVIIDHGRGRRERVTGDADAGRSRRRDPLRRARRDRGGRSGGAPRCRRGRGTAR